MKLEEFVAQSLTDVLRGVCSAQNTAETMTIGASSRSAIKQLLPGLMQDAQGALYTTVDFDIAVTVAHNGAGQASVDVMGFKAGGGGGTQHHTVSRIKFSVPIRFK